MEIGLRVCHQLVHRTRPEDASDHGGRLKRRLVGFGEEIYARGEHCLDRIRDLESRWKVLRMPATVASLEETGVDEAAQHFLDEEWVSLGVLDDETPYVRWEVAAEQRVDERRCRLRGQRLERDRLGVHPTAPRRPRLHEVGTSRRDQKERTLHIAAQALDQVQKRLLGPVNVLDENDNWCLGCKLRQELHPGRV